MEIRDVRDNLRVENKQQEKEQRGKNSFSTFEKANLAGVSSVEFM